MKHSYVLITITSWLNTYMVKYDKYYQHTDILPISIYKLLLGFWASLVVARRLEGARDLHVFQTKTY